MCYCGNTGVERTPNKESAHKVDWRRKFSRCSCRDSNSQSSDHESGALTNKLSRLKNILLIVEIVFIGALITEILQRQVV